MILSDEKALAIKRDLVSYITYCLSAYENKHSGQDFADEREFSIHSRQK